MTMNRRQFLKNMGIGAAGAALPCRRARRAHSGIADGCHLANSPFFMQSINEGIFTPTGQPETQGIFLQFKQRLASFTAISAVYPSATS